MPLDAARILITGAGSGIGRALAIDASRRGATLHLCGRRLDKLEETLSLLKPGRPHIVLPGDITGDADRARIHQIMAAQTRGLDILVNNAGLVMGGTFETSRPDDIQRLFNTNVIAPILMTQRLLPLLAAGRSPRVVNVGSMFGEIPFPNFVAYSASKAAIKGFSVALRRELRTAGVAVTYAAPRATDTDAAAAVEHLNGSKSQKLDDPNRLAGRIWDAVDLGKDAIYPSGAERLFIMLQTAFPWIMDRALSQRPSREKDISHVQQNG